PEWRIGGTAGYAAAAAARFGARAALVTRVGPHERERLADRCARLGITLHALQSEVTTTFAFRYVDGKRQLRLKARAKGIAAEALPADVRETRSVVFASIAHELDRSLFGVFAGAPRVLGPRGWGSRSRTGATSSRRRASRTRSRRSRWRPSASTGSPTARVSSSASMRSRRTDAPQAAWSRSWSSWTFTCAMRGTRPTSRRREPCDSAKQTTKYTSETKSSTSIGLKNCV